MIRHFTLRVLFKKEFLSLFILILFTSTVIAQDRCATVNYSKAQLNKSLRENNDRFEKWLSKKVVERESSMRAQRAQTITYHIPVVVHIIHNGEAVGTGTNLSNAQVIAQIKVLNDDFNRLNKDTTLTPLEFQGVAGKINIEFVLAKQAPDGSPTTGIMRAQGAKTLWFFGSDDSQLKATSYWPAEDYFNIWVCNLDNYLGYTQFPESSLPGLDNSPNNRLTDGVVIAYKYFGTKDGVGGPFDLEPRYNLGRTVTHETGHFFGLRHIWGDDELNNPANQCMNNGGSSDFVNDTPDQAKATESCPKVPVTTCSVHNMYQNYLDYTDDACMNMFSAGQVTRMTTVIENSPRRLSLLTSHGLTAPVATANDLALVKIDEPGANTCVDLITPTIEIRNGGTNLITSAKIQLTVNGLVTETKDFPLNLNLGESATVTFTSQSLPEGYSPVEFEVVSVNNTTDGTPWNNKKDVSTLYSAMISTPLMETFSAPPTNWIIQNSDSQITWHTESVPNAHGSNTAMLLNFYDYNQLTTSDVLISPPFDLTGKTTAFLSFDMAYAPRFQGNADQLRVLISPGCTTDIGGEGNMGIGDELFNKSGTGLATTMATSVFFVPHNDAEWKRVVLDISQYAGQGEFRVAFIGTNMSGNNIYLDNVGVVTTSYADLAITSVNSPVVISCSNPIPRITVSNIGTVPITTFTVKAKLNGIALPDKVMTNTLSPGADFNVALDQLTLTQASNALVFSVSAINGAASDANEDNNTQSVSVNVNTNSKIIPIRENFNSMIPADWLTLSSPANGVTWESTVVDANHDKAVYVRDFGNTDLGSEAWLITPSLDFSRTRTNVASVYFDHSYGFNQTGVDELRVVASSGCGNAFDKVVFAKSSNNLANTITEQSWKPHVDADWTRDGVILNELIGQTDVHLAFLMTNQNGNNLYVDNIEFFESNDQSPATSASRFSIHYKDDSPVDFFVKVNLVEQQMAKLVVVDVMGRVVLTDTLQYSLNQDYPVLLHDASSGIYIVKVSTAEGSYSQKVVITK